MFSPLFSLYFPSQRQQYIEQIEYFQHARLEVANKKKQVLRQTRTLGGPHKRAKAHGRRGTKSGTTISLFLLYFLLHWIGTSFYWFPLRSRLQC